MTVELFDRVDQNDRIIGTTHKAEAHEKGYIHRVVAVYVFDENGDLYVQEHVKANLLDHSVGGHVTKAEPYELAASREAEEELGIVQPLEFLGTFYSDETYTGSNYYHMFGLFRCTADPDWKFEPNEEVHKIYPLSLEDIVDRMNKRPQDFTPGFLNTMEYYLKTTNSELKLELDSYKGKQKAA